MSVVRACQRVPATIAGPSTWVCRDGTSQPDQTALDAGRVIGAAAADIRAFVSGALRGGDADSLGKVIARGGAGAVAIDCG